MDAPRDFRIPISRVLSVMAVYIARKITKKPTSAAVKLTKLMKYLRAEVLLMAEDN